MNKINHRDSEILSINDSRLLNKVIYFNDNNTMMVKFKNGGKLYLYLNVDRCHFNSMIELNSKSESVGSYFLNEIKPNHSFRVLEQLVEAD